MLALMVSALAGSLGSRNAPDASLNQLATSTETVKFEVPGPTVIGVANSISISASPFVPVVFSSISFSVTCAAESERAAPLAPALAVAIEVEVANLVVTERLSARLPGPVDSHAARATAREASHATERG